MPVFYYIAHQNSIPHMKKHGLTPRSAENQNVLMNRAQGICVFINLQNADKAIATWLGSNFKDGTKLAIPPLHTLQVGKPTTMLAIRRLTKPVTPRQIDFYRGRPIIISHDYYANYE